MQPQRRNESRVTTNPIRCTKRGGICVLLLPLLLLLPTLHFHPAHAHTHGAAGEHDHVAVLHTDFFPVADHAHKTHREHHDPEDVPSFPPLIRLTTLLPRTPVLFTSAVQQAFGVPLVESSATVCAHCYSTKIFTTTHAPPIQNHACSPSAPRSPPRFV